MSQPTLPVNRVVNVGVQLTPAGAQAQSLSNLLILGTSTVIDPVERFRNYATIDEVANDFGLLAEEYLAALKWFSQSPQPTELIIARWFDAAAAGGLRGGTLSTAQQAIATFNAIIDGSFTVSVDGAAAVDVTGLDFSAAANLNAVAAIIDAALAGASVVWNANYQRFEFTSATTGILSSVSFLTTAGAGTDISNLLGCRSTFSGAYIFEGVAAESAVEAVQEMDSVLGQRWYAANVPSAVDDDHLAIAAYIEAATNKHIYGVTSQAAGILSAVSTTDIAYVLSELGYKRTILQYSSSDANAVVSALARLLTTNFQGSATVITLKFKQEPGVVAEYLNSSQATAAENKNANIFVNYNNDTAILEQGVMVDGTFADIVTGTDWLAVEIQTQLYNLLFTSTTKIPQTDAGMQLLTTTVEAVCSQGVTNGLLAPGQWNANGFGILKQGDYLPKGFYVYSAPVATQPQNLRTARLAMPIQVAAKLAGAIHSVDVLVTVNQ